MSQRIVTLDKEDVAFVARCVRATKSGTAMAAGTLPLHMTEVRSAAMAVCDRAERIAKTLETAQRVTVTVPEGGEE